MKRITLSLILAGTLAACGTGTQPYNPADSGTTSPNPGTTPAPTTNNDLEQDSTIDKPIEAKLETEYEGVIAGQPQDKDYYVFEAKAGQDIDIAVKRNITVPDNTLDPYFYLQMHTGKYWSEVAKVDGNDFNNKDFAKVDAFYNLIAPQSTKYRVVVTSFDIANQAKEGNKVVDDKTSNRYVLTIKERQ